MAFEPTKANARIMIKTYEQNIAQFSDISLYGPPTRHMHYMQLYSGETREEMLRIDLERLAYWKGVLNEHCPLET